MHARPLIVIAAAMTCLSTTPIAVAAANPAAPPGPPGQGHGLIDDAVPVSPDGSADVGEEGDLEPAGDTSESAGTATMTASVIEGSVYPSPSGCRGRSNNPHQSTSYDTYGDMKGLAKTYCLYGAAPYMAVKASIWRDRWWGYQQMGSDPLGEKTWAYSVQRSGHWADCDSNTWRTVGQHYVEDINAEVYTLETMNYEEIDCW